MTKAELKVLERVFTAEIDGALPAQFKSKLLPEMEKAGYVVQIEETLGGRFPVKIKGWALTELGRMTHCASCGEIE
jgi:hypothetical protein